MRKTKGMLMGFALVVVSCLSVVATVAPHKAAAASPYLWDDRKDMGVVALRGGPSLAANKPTWVVEGTKFTMYCWLDNHGSRWFWGQALGRTGKIGYVQAQYVKAQVPVSRC